MFSQKIAYRLVFPREADKLTRALTYWQCSVTRKVSILISVHGVTEQAAQDTYSEAKLSRKTAGQHKQHPCSQPPHRQASSDVIRSLLIVKMIINAEHVLSILFSNNSHVNT